MIEKSDLLNFIRAEIQIIKHLGAKAKQEFWNYRPHAKQRSLLELMQYLSHAGATSVEYIQSGNWNHAKANADDALKVNLSNFSQAMDEQLAKIERLVDAMGDLSQKEVKTPAGQVLKADAALIDLPLKFFVAYRMQLFLYLKGCGLQELGTSNCWRGVDA